MKHRDRQISLPGFEPPPQESPPPDPAGNSAADTRPAPHGPPPESLAAAGTAARAAPVSPPPESLQGQTVWVVDSHSLIYQVFHALPEMASPRGEPVAAVYGFTRDLLYLLEEKRPDFLFCAFDLPGPTFRHEIYDQYKIQRAEMPEDLVPQIDSIRRVIQALGVPAVGSPSYEADDVMATIARATEELGGRCFLVSGDKDCRQLISDRVKVYNIRKNRVFDRDDLMAEWGISPKQVVDFQALVGDPVDNVPGVPLIGPKLARQLLGEYGTLENVLDHAAEVSGPKRKENLLKHRDQALLSRRLVRLETHVPVAIDWNAGRLDGFDLCGARELFHQFGFRSLAEKLELLQGQAAAEVPARTFGGAASCPTDGRPEYRLVDTPEKLAEFLPLLRRQKCISCDTETANISSLWAGKVWPRWAEIVGFSFAFDDHQAWYLPVRAPDGEPCLDLNCTLEALRPVLEDPAVEKLGQNLKYDMLVLRSAGIALAGLAFDSMVAGYLLDPGARNHSLNDLAKRYLHHATIKIEELIGTGKNQKRMDEVPVRQVADYASEDALLPLRLRPVLTDKLAQTGLQELFTQLELPLVDVLVELEYNGIEVDVRRLADLSRRYGERIDTLQQEIHELAGRPFNVASPKQLQQVLFTELRLPVSKKTKTGPSTDAAVLEELARLHPLPAKLLEYRRYAKLKSTYVDALPQMVHPTTGRVHASFNQHVTATGRLSSSDPNLQNIPVRTQQGRGIRSAFVPGSEGWLLMAADYSQIELRVLAHFSGDSRLCEAFARDEDIHARVAGQVNGAPLEDVTPEMRSAAKAVNFGVIYGQSPFGLSRALGIEKEQAAQFIDSYFEGYPGIEEFLATVLAECRRNGYVRTIRGRRRTIRGVRPQAGRQRNLAERTAVNTVIQGSAADLIKMAMVAIHRRLRREKLPAKMLLQIHDELIFEVPSDHVQKLADLVTEEMVGVQQLNVPLKVDVKAGPNWADAKPIGD